MRKFVVATPLMLGAITVSAAAHASCSELTKNGIYDVTQRLNEVARTKAFRRWMCQSQFSSAQELKDWGATAGLPIGDIPVELGFDSNSQNWQEFKSEYCSDNTFDESLQIRTETVVKTINPALVNALQACLTQGGLHAAVMQGPTDEEFLFVTSFRPTGPGKDPVVQQFDASANVQCRNPPKRGMTIGLGGWESICVRKDKQGSTISYTTTHKVVWDTPQMLAPIIIPPAPPPPQRLDISACDFSIVEMSSGNITCGAPFGSVIRNNSDTHQHNMVQYRFRAIGPGSYSMYVTYGSAGQTRPVHVRVNGTQLYSNRLSVVNGCYHDTCVVSGLIGTVRLRQGWNTVRIDSNDVNVFPHMKDLMFIPDDIERALLLSGELGASAMPMPLK